MRLADVIGTVTLSRSHPSLQGLRYVVGVPLSLKALREGLPGDGEDLVMVDELGAGAGSRVAFSEGVEAAAPYSPNKKPVDAFVAALIDRVTFSEGQS
jgi:ethanolamine utilization protein EutN